jgi:hypothetical protein
MKDLELKDIFPRFERKINKLSVYTFGVWKFAIPSNPIKQTLEANYYKINFKFGVLNSNQIDPRNTKARGEAGDYLVQDINNNYSVMTQAEYNLYFPTALQEVKKEPLTSNALKNPQFLTDILKNSEESSSNIGKAASLAPPKPSQPTTSY